MEPVLGIVSVGYRAVGGGLGGTVAVCVVGVHLRPEHLRGGQESAAVPHPHKKPGQFGVLTGGQVAVGEAADAFLPVQSVLPGLLYLNKRPEILNFSVQTMAQREKGIASINISFSPCLAPPINIIK